MPREPHTSSEGEVMSSLDPRSSPGSSLFGELVTLLACGEGKEAGRRVEDGREEQGNKGEIFGRDEREEIGNKSTRKEGTKK
ncbi:hypothetical protein E2C01_011722 [Portunus trituberculatus]|uniref:Uncharacterized protein n=1 Tax=Portunus trituberculatus TaxID=210409 RepID=A0A5B7DBV5_PORTR|nr:hypothetical protein [Portunus trituberculatus]